MKIMTVVGARPNFMKAAPIIAAIREHNDGARRANAALPGAPPVPIIDHTLVHTGQHYDAAMSDAFFADLQLPPPDIRLGVGSGSHSVQTAEVLKRFEEVLLTHRPDVVIVVGDVNSTLACALVTSKISFDSAGARPLLAHVEAGLRSFDRSMPEEVNRVVTDHVADLLFVTEPSAVRNLRNEGLPADAVHFVGNTMIDSLLASREKAEDSAILENLQLRRRNGGKTGSIARYGLLTLHRPANVDNPAVFRSILAGLEELAAQCPVVFPTHPRTQARIREFGLESCVGTNGIDAEGATPRTLNGRHGIIAVDPLGYLDFLCLMKHAALVVTDSGGIQEETTCLGVPCVTVRENTERPVTVESGTNVIAGTTQNGIAAAVRRQMGANGAHTRPEKWDGKAGRRIVGILVAAHVNRVAAAQSALQTCV